MATKEEWKLIIDQEEGELFVLSLIEDIIHESQQILFRKYIDIQILPYSVQYAHDAIRELVNVRHKLKSFIFSQEILAIPTFPCGKKIQVKTS
jgi:hypothetical protein